MIDPEIKEQLDRIEQYSLIAAKNVLNIKEAAIILGMTVRGVRENVTLLQEERVGRLDDAEPQQEHGRDRIRGSSLLCNPLNR